MPNRFEEIRDRYLTEYTTPLPSLVPTSLTSTHGSPVPNAHQLQVELAAINRRMREELLHHSDIRTLNERRDYITSLLNSDPDTLRGTNAEHAVWYDEALSTPASIADDWSAIQEVIRPPTPINLEPGALNYTRDRDDLPNTPRSRPTNRRPSGPSHGRSFEPPAWKKFPCLLNLDRRRTGKTTKLLKEMLSITENDCYFLSPDSGQSRNAMRACEELLKSKSVKCVPDTSNMSISVDDGAVYKFKPFSIDTIASLRGKGEHAIFVDNLNHCLKALFHSHTLVSLSWEMGDT